MPTWGFKTTNHSLFTLGSLSYSLDVDVLTCIVCCSLYCLCVPLKMNMIMNHMYHTSLSCCWGKANTCLDQLTIWRPIFIIQNREFFLKGYKFAAGGSLAFLLTVRPPCQNHITQNTLTANNFKRPWWPSEKDKSLVVFIHHLWSSHSHVFKQTHTADRIGGHVLSLLSLSRDSAPSVVGLWMQVGDLPVNVSWLRTPSSLPGFTEEDLAEL